MAVRIRMKRMGRRHRPFFRISVMDARSPRDGRSIEDIGYYDPMVRDKTQRIQLKMDRVDYWMSVGAQPTEKVAVLIKKVKTNSFSEAKEPPPLTPPKQPPPPEPIETSAEAETEAAETETTETAAEESAAESAESESSKEATEGEDADQ